MQSTPIRPRIPITPQTGNRQVRFLPVDSTTLFEKTPSSGRTYSEVVTPMYNSIPEPGRVVTPRPEVPQIIQREQNYAGRGQASRAGRTYLPVKRYGYN